MAGVYSNVKIEIKAPDGSIIHQEEVKNKILNQTVKALATYLLLDYTSTLQTGTQVGVMGNQNVGIPPVIHVGSSTAATNVQYSGAASSAMTIINTLPTVIGNTSPGGSVFETSYTSSSNVGSAGGIWDLPSVTSISELGLSLPMITTEAFAVWNIALTTGASARPAMSSKLAARVSSGDSPGLTPFVFQLGQVPPGSILTVTWAIRITSV